MGSPLPTASQAREQMALEVEGQRPPRGPRSVEEMGRVLQAGRGDAPAPGDPSTRGGQGRLWPTHPSISLPAAKCSRQNEGLETPQMGILIPALPPPTSYVTLSKEPKLLTPQCLQLHKKMTPPLSGSSWG